jgi:hypothetical protein
MVVHVYNLNTWETKVGGLWIKSKPRLHSETLTKKNIKKEIEKSKDSTKSLFKTHEMNLALSHYRKCSGIWITIMTGE